MDDFRPVWFLCAYSGGTVPDSHRIHYSLPGLDDHGSTQTDILFVGIIPLRQELCQ